MGEIRVQGLGKAYKQYRNRWARLAEWMSPSGRQRHELRWVLRETTFQVGAGEAVGVVGPNGAGKSTLLKLITGTTQSTTGTVNVDGRVSALLELGMGFHPDFTGRQNAFMAGQLLGMSLEEVSGHMAAIEEFAGIGSYMDQPLRVYSSGMQVRLAFSVATARRPDVLIIDEALSVGDAQFQHKSFGRIREFQDRGTTLLLVSHDLGAIRSICSRALWLEGGRLMEQGDTRTVLDAYAASVYASRQDIAGARSIGPAGPTDRAPSVEDAAEEVSPRDCRQDFIDSTTLRNDIRVVALERKAGGWGTGAVQITGARLQRPTGEALDWVLGGEMVRLVIEAVASGDKERVIAGFIVKDRTGQPLFGDNTFLRYVDEPVTARAGSRIIARFEFRMPVLPRGTYMVAVAVASGTQFDHVIHEWIDEALLFESQNANSIQGLIGIPMTDIGLEIAEPGS